MELRKLPAKFTLSFLTVVCFSFVTGYITLPEESLIIDITRPTYWSITSFPCPSPMMFPNVAPFFSLSCFIPSTVFFGTYPMFSDVLVAKNRWKTN